MYEDVAKQEVENGELCYLSLKGYSIERPLYFIYPCNSLMKGRNETFYRNLTARGILWKNYDSEIIP